MIGALPTSLTVGGSDFSIRTNFRDVLHILEAFQDPDLETEDKILICLHTLFEDFWEIPQEDYEEAYQQASWFIDGGSPPKEEKKNHRIMDWEQDAHILFPAINAVAGFEVRSSEYVHWWTFLGYFMEIHEGVFSQVLHLRQKKAKRKKLEKWEKEFWKANREMCVLQERLSSEERAERDRLEELLG